ncbi:hypothetical protein ABPG77_002718 [Micractinium sp. CCAP 211/92]
MTSKVQGRIIPSHGSKWWATTWDLPSTKSSAGLADMQREEHLHAKARAIVPELLLTLQDRTKAVAGGSGGGSSEVWRYRARPPANASKLLHLICLISALDSCNS